MKDEMIKHYYLRCTKENILNNISSEYNGYISEYVANIRVSGLYVSKKLFTSDSKDKRKDIYKALTRLIGEANMTNEDYITRIEAACAALRLYVDSRGVSNE